MVTLAAATDIMQLCLNQPPHNTTPEPQVQTVLGIFDLRGFTSANADWGFVRFLVDIFFLYYPKARRQL